jgi:hypothetical protein
MFANLHHITRSCRILIILPFLLHGMRAVSQEATDTVVVTDTVSKGVVAPPEAGPDTTPGNTYQDNQESGAIRSANKDRRTEEAIRVRHIPDSVIRRYKGEKEFAYANDPAFWKKARPEEVHPSAFGRWLGRVLNSEAFRWLIYLLLGGALLYTIYKIVSENNLATFYRSPAKTKTAGAVEDPVDEDLEAKLREAMQAGDYRAAVRYLYLGTLRTLRDKEWIQYHIESTNQEYVRQLSALPQGASFRWLTGAYEKVWYGEFPLNTDQFGRLHSHFAEFQKSIGPS